MTTTQTPESQAIEAISPAEALFLMASGQNTDLQTIDRLKKELHVSRQKGTATLLAVIKRFPNKDAFVSADTLARDKAKNAHRATEGGTAVSEKALLKLAVDPTYLTGCDQVRSAASVLGWEAVQQATSIGSLYAAARAKKSEGQPKGTQAPAGKPADTMEREPIPVPDALFDALTELSAALESLPDDVAVSIIRDALLAATMAAAKAS